MTRATPAANVDHGASSGLHDGAEDLTGVHRRLGDFFSHLRTQAALFGDADPIVDALRSASSGGKNVRPDLVLRVHRALIEDDSDAVFDVAAAFELLHTALVVHDDIIDRDWSRGKPNVAGIFQARASAMGLSSGDAEHHGASAAIIAGDLALAGALRLIATARGVPATADVIAHSHRAKTSVYTFEAPMQAGAVLAGASEYVIEQLREFGQHLGMPIRSATTSRGFSTTSTSPASPLHVTSGARSRPRSPFTRRTARDGQKSVICSGSTTSTLQTWHRFARCSSTTVRSRARKSMLGTISPPQRTR